MTHNFDYDYFVIGGGSGGVRSARIAAGHGAKVGIAEGKHWGGTCVNVGCVPKKLFSYAADYGPAFKDAEGYGWNAENISFNWQTLLENKNKEIERLNGIYSNLLGNANVTSYEGYASFKDAHTVIVNGKEITSDKFLIAVGGTPRQPTYEGAELTVNSDEVFYIDALPQHIVIEGGGYIAVEFAHIFHGLGCDVTITYRKDVLVREFDRDIADFLTQEMEKQGINLKLNTNIQKIEKTDRLFVSLEDEIIGLFGKDGERQASFDKIPTAIFSNPEIGTVGLSEEKAQDKGFDVEIFKSTFKPMRHTLSGRDEKTMMKLVVDKKTDKVIGAHMCGADAAEMMQGIGIALQCGATKADFDRTIGIHPTSAEEWVTMK